MVLNFLRPVVLRIFREEFPNLDVFGKITLGNNVYVGNDVLIMPGITIGNNVIIAAGSVVTKSFPDNCIIGGNPAKIISSVEKLRMSMLELDLNLKNYSYDKKKIFY